MKLLGNLLLFIVSITLLTALTGIGMIYGTICAFWKRQFKTGINSISIKLLRLATTIDLLGAIVCYELMNDALITKSSARPFGPTGITISETLGHNQITETLTGTGKWLVSVLDFIEPNHCLKAAGYI